MRLSEVTKKSSETKADPSWSKTFLAPLPLPRQHSKNIQFATRPAEGWCMWPLRFWACTTISLLKNSAINWLGMMEALDTDTWQIQSWIWFLVKNTITMTTTVDCGCGFGDSDFGPIFVQDMIRLTQEPHQKMEVASGWVPLGAMYFSLQERRSVDSKMKMSHPDIGHAVHIQST